MFPISQRRKQRCREVKLSPTPITQRIWEPRPCRSYHDVTLCSRSQWSSRGILCSQRLTLLTFPVTRKSLLRSLNRERTRLLGRVTGRVEPSGSLCRAEA